MASAADASRPLSASSPLIAVHRIFGGGKASDVFLWRRRIHSSAALAAATAAWCLFELAGYRLLPLFANALLLAVAILFFWAKSASFLQRPLPPLPNLEIPDQVVEKVAEEVSGWIDTGMQLAQDIATGKDKKLVLKVVPALRAISYIGSLFTFLTWMYIGFLVLISVPALYEKYHDHIDVKLISVHNLAQKHCGDIFDRYGTFAEKEKKFE